MQMNSSTQQNRLREENGFSMVTVMLVGMVSTLWLTAMFCTILPSYQKVSKVRTQSILRSASEAAADWAVQQLQGAGSSIEDTNMLDSFGTTSQIPSSVLQGMGFPITGTITVWAPRYPSSAPSGSSGVPVDSYLFDPLLVVSGNQDTGWRVVDVTTRVAGSTNAAQSNRIRVVLRPNTTNVPVQALQASSLIQLNGTPRWTTDSYDSRNGSYGGANVSNSNGSIASNGGISITNTQIGGDVTASTTATQGAGVTVSGTVQQNAPQVQIPAAPMAPASANSTYTSILTNTVLPPGDYVVNNINLASNRTLTTNGSANSPVRIWVQGPNAAINLAGTAAINNNGTPPALQIYYSGSADVTIATNGSFKGVLYAPNAPVRLNGNSQGYGSITARAITMNSGGSGNGGFHYDRALANANLLSSVVMSRRQVVSWQEI